MLKKSPKHVWSEVGASRQDYTSASSETLGELDKMKEEKDKNNKPLDEQLREKGLL
jgi:hypothetical protein